MNFLEDWKVKEIRLAKGRRLSI